jgi:hypothetical protein
MQNLETDDDYGKRQRDKNVTILRVKVRHNYHNANEKTPTTD